MWDNIYVANVVQGSSALAVPSGLPCSPAIRSTPALIAAALFAFTPYFVKTFPELMTDMPAVTMLAACGCSTARVAARAGIASALAGRRASRRCSCSSTRCGCVLSGPGSGAFCGLSPARSSPCALPHLAWWNHGSFFYSFAHASRIDGIDRAGPRELLLRNSANFPGEHARTFRERVGRPYVERSRPDRAIRGAGVISRFAISTFGPSVSRCWPGPHFSFTSSNPAQEVRTCRWPSR